MSGFPGCKWCGGRGCIACEAEEAKYKARRMEPIFTARMDNENDLALLKQFLGRDALERAFGPGGGGIREVELNAAVASFVQALNSAPDAPAATPTPESAE